MPVHQKCSSIGRYVDVPVSGNYSLFPSKWAPYVCKWNSILSRANFNNKQMARPYLSCKALLSLIPSAGPRICIRSSLPNLSKSGPAKRKSVQQMFMCWLKIWEIKLHLFITLFLNSLEETILYHQWEVSKWRLEDPVLLDIRGVLFDVAIWESHIFSSHA